MKKELVQAVAAAAAVVAVVVVGSIDNQQRVKFEALQVSAKERKN